MDTLTPSIARLVVTQHDHDIVRLTSDDAWTLVHALRLVTATINADVTTMTSVAATLRAGGSVTMFADGEAGAVAADHLANAHRTTLDKVLAMIDLFETADQMLVLAAADEVAE